MLIEQALQGGADMCRPPLLTTEQLAQTEATIIDVRSPGEFDRGHLAGSLVVPVGGHDASAQVAWLVDRQEQLVVLGRSFHEARRFAVRLHAVGLTRVIGVAVADVLRWEAEGLPVRRSRSITVDDLAARLHGHGVHLVDVRDNRDYKSGHVTGSASLPLHQLPTRRFARGEELALVCNHGGRAATAASVLRLCGHREVVPVAGGGVNDLTSFGIQLEAA